MDCEREGCGHPLAVHDPCTAKGCTCQAYEPADRKQRAALITDIYDEPGKRPPTTKAEHARWLRELRAAERARLGGLS